MNKRERQLLDNKAQKFDHVLIALTIVMIFFIGCLVRVKVLTGYMDYSLKGLLPSTSNLFTYYKLQFLVIFVVILFLVFIARTLNYKLGIRKDYVFFSTLAILIFAILSTFNNPLGIAKVWGFYTRTHGLLAYLSLFVLLFVLSNLYISSKGLKYLIYGLNLFSIFIVIFGCFQFVGLDPFQYDWCKNLYIPSQYNSASINIKAIKNSAYSIMSHYNYFGAFCSIFFALLFSYAVKSEKTVDKVFFFIGSISLFIGVLIAASQGALFTLLIVLLVLPIVFLNRDTIKEFLIMYGSMIIIAVIFTISFDTLLKNELFPGLIVLLSNIKYLVLILFLLLVYIAVILSKKFILKFRAKYLSITIVAVVVICIGGFVLFLNTGVKDHLHIFTDRGYVWYHTNELIKEHPVLGYGPDNLYYAFPQGNPDKAQYSAGQVFDKPHNMYLQMAVDTGVFGLIAFLFLLTMYLLSLAKAQEFETDRAKLIYIQASFVVIMAYMIQGFVNDNHLAIQPIVFLIMGIGMSMSRSSIAMVNKK